MRYIFTFMIAMLICATSFAQNDGKLTISLPSDQFTVIVNGRIYDIVNNSVTLENIRAGEYRIKIYRYNGGAESFMESTPPLCTTFIVVKPNFHVDLMISQDGKIYVGEKPRSDLEIWRFDDLEI